MRSTQQSGELRRLGSALTTTEASYMSVIIADLCFSSVLETLRAPSVCPEELRSPRTAGQKPMKPQPRSPRNSELRGKSSHVEAFKCNQTDPGDDTILPRVRQALKCQWGAQHQARLLSAPARCVVAQATGRCPRDWAQVAVPEFPLSPWKQ